MNHENPSKPFTEATGYATLCPICRKQIENPSTRLDSQGRRWCKACEDYHDSIDWHDFYHGDANPADNARELSDDLKP